MRVSSLFLLMLLAAPLAAAPGADRPYRMAAGVNLGGGQIDWRINRRWMLEARAQAGRASSDGADVDSQVIGLRAYRFLAHGRPEFFIGAEAAAASARRKGTAFNADGWAGGLFGGLQIGLLRHLFLLADGGPYLVSLREKDTGVSDGTVNFVADLALVVGF